MSWIPHHQDEIKITPPSEAGEGPYEPVGEEVQRLSVLQSLPSLLKGDSSLCMQRVVPKVQLALPNASTEFHMAASSTFLTILEKKLVHPRTFTQTFLQSILSSIESRDPVVANAWLETLLDVMDLLPSEVIRSEILPIAVTKGQISQIVSSRLTACKLLGKVCTRFEPYMLKKEALPVVLSLCQDVNYEVRACICSQLKYVAIGLGPDGSKIALLPSLVELASDEEPSVRLAAVETIVEVLPHLQADVLKHTIVPLVKKLCTQSMNSEDDVLSVISHHLGQLCLGLDNYLTMSEKAWFMMYYQQLAELGVPNMRSNIIRKEFSSMMSDLSSESLTDRFIICRQNCAYNFPAMAMFTTRQGESFHEQLYSTFCDLACDPYFLVRRTIACGIHEVTSVLGPACGMVKNELVKLLRDDAEEVLQGLIPNIAKTMELLAKTGNIGPDNMDTTSIEIGRALVKCEAEISETHNWRLHSLLLAQMECLPNCLPSEFIYSHFVPIMFTRIHTARPIPCRLAAARTLLVLLRYNQKPIQKNDIRTRICAELGQGYSCYSRMMFVKLSITAMELFSRRYFKDYFYLHLLDLADDKVPNIRLQLVSQLPRLKGMLRIPSDRKLLLAMESLIRKLLMNEKDRDVAALLNNVIQELDKIEVQVEVPTTTSHLSKDDLEDQRKFDEELRLCSAKTDPTKKKSVDRKALNVASSTSVRTLNMHTAGARRGLTSRGMETRETVSKMAGTPGRTTVKQRERKMPSSSTSSVPSSRDNVMSGHLLSCPSGGISKPPAQASYATCVQCHNTIDSSAATLHLQHLNAFRILRESFLSSKDICMGNTALDTDCQSSSHFHNSIECGIPGMIQDNCFNSSPVGNAALLPSILQCCFFESNQMLPPELKVMNSSQERTCRTQEYVFPACCGSHSKAQHNNVVKSSNCYDKEYNHPVHGVCLQAENYHMGDGFTQNNELHESNYGVSSINFRAEATNHNPFGFNFGGEFIISSLEDEFYVDAGIRIPQQLAASDLAPFPSRIPNLREILFKNHSPGVSNSNLQPPKISVTISIDTKQDFDDPSTVNTSSKPKVRCGLPLKKNIMNNSTMDHVTNDNCKYTSPTQTVHKSTLARSVNKRNAGINATKAEQHCVSSLKDKICLSDHKQKESIVIANRRHSYMDGEKIARGPEGDGKYNEMSSIRRALGSAGNRRHSYIEKVSTDDSEKNNQGQFMRWSYGCGQNISSNKRHSYMERANSSIASFKKGSMSNVDTLNKHKSLVLKQSEKNIRRVSSLDRASDASGVEACTSSAAQTVKHSAENKPRHSSLERDRVIAPAYLQGAHVHIDPSKEVWPSNSTTESSIRIGKGMYKNDLSSNSQSDLLDYSVSDENLELGTLRKGTNLCVSKIPRGGAASCHSSPGGSRPSSPTGGNVTRVRQRTAPNSRAASPTGTRKGHQRLSLGSLNCYMSSLKLSDSASRLPIRKT